MEVTVEIDADLGSPAHAGIDLALSKEKEDESWFPRTRGDRPNPTQPYVSSTMVPPHTRG